MILKYGNYAFDDGGVRITIDKTYTTDDLGEIDRRVETWTVAGEIQGASQAAITTALSKLEGSFGTNGENLILYYSDGSTPSQHQMAGTDCLEGPIVRSLTYPKGDGPEYAAGAFRSFQIVLEGVFEEDATDEVVSWNETLSMPGGATEDGKGPPRYVWVETVEGAPQKFQVAEQTILRATQSGAAVGRTTWPDPPDPIFREAHLPEMDEITKTSPQYHSGTGTHRLYQTSWKYEFASNRELNGTPGEWSQ